MLQLQHDVILGLTAMIQIWKWPKPVTTLHLWIMVDSSMMVKLHANNVIVLCLCPWITYLQRIPDVSCMRKFLSFYNLDWIKNSEWIKNSKEWEGMQRFNRSCSTWMKHPLCPLSMLILWRENFADISLIATVLLLCNCTVLLTKVFCSSHVAHCNTAFIKALYLEWDMKYNVYD